MRFSERSFKNAQKQLEKLGVTPTISGFLKKWGFSLGHFLPPLFYTTVLAVYARIFAFKRLEKGSTDRSSPFHV